MLPSLAPYPQTGSAAFLKPDGTPVRIVQRRADGRFSVSHTQPGGYDRASKNVTVAEAELAETRDAAILFAPKRPRRSARA